MNCGKWISLAGVAAVMAVVGLAIVGCDDSAQNNEIIVSPSATTIYGVGSVVVFTASGKGIADTDIETNRAPRTVVDQIFLPVDWSVSDPELGSIAGREGFTAVYVSTGKIGNQIVTVHDQGTSRGIAVVQQTEVPPDTNAVAAATAGLQ